MPLQLPGLAVRVWPLCGVPEIVGGWVLTGGVDCPCTTAVGLDVAVACPATFEAVTATRRVEPTSLSVAVYVEETAPEIGLQPVPLESQRCHW